MLIKASTLQGYKLESLDGDIGEVSEFYFDDRHWTVRYLVADTGNWLKSRKVLLSPYALNQVIKSERHLSVNLTRKQIEKSPSLATHKPVSEQFEMDYHAYYGWPAYWNGSSVWGSWNYLERDLARHADSPKGAKAFDRHLRSTLEMTGYHLEALDGEIGHVVDFIIDDNNWSIRYLVVGTRNWWPGKRVLVSPQWIERISWSESKIHINLSRGTIKDSPEFTQDALLTRDYEVSLHRHYNRKGYWIDELAAL